MDILMPQLGETVTEGKITKWFKAAGDAVKPGDNLFEIETDKTSMEVPATSAGVLVGDSRRRRRGGAGRRGGGGDFGRMACGIVIDDFIAGAHRHGGESPRIDPSRRVCPPSRATHAAFRAAPPHARVYRSRSTRGTPCARRRKISAPRACRAAPSSRRWRDGLPPKPEIDLGALSPSGPHGRIVARDVETAAAKAGKSLCAAAALRWRAVPAPTASRRCSSRAHSRKSRSMPCAGPSLRGWSKPSRPCRISISRAMSRSNASRRCARR